MIPRIWPRRLLAPAEGRRSEYLARVLTVGILCGFAVALLVVSLGWLQQSANVIELVARQPAAGGWSRERIVVNQGERVRLRIRSEDVVHGFAIGRTGVEAGPIEPGKVATFEFVADQPGEFTYYCTMWCDPNHPRMRGILEVRGPHGVASTSGVPASDVALQHLDSPRDAGVVPAAVPSARRGLPLYTQRCASCHGERGQGTARGTAIGEGNVIRDRSPVDVFQMMAQTSERQGRRHGAAHDGAVSVVSKVGGSHGRFPQDWSEQERWDVVAAVWSLGSTADRLTLGQRLYAKNCAACHGEQGRGDGPGGRNQPKKPADFTDARRMLAGSTALYTAKIRRGGMGTGMPYWGSIFTEDELAGLVGSLWAFSMDILQ